jgi:tetratricopeptide (TPR) repeat protein
VLTEFKRYFGEIWIDLGQSVRNEGRYFVNAYLDSEPNQLGSEFRRTLYQHTEGNPLFITELMREMQERGDIVKDDWGRWIEGDTLNWQKLPAKIEGVVEERIGRLDEESKEVLSIASVEGDTFTAEVVAQVQQLDDRGFIRQLSQQIEKKYRLVTSKDVRRLDSGQRLSLFQFEHNLFQIYLYNDLGEVQRVILHEEIGNVLETMYRDDLSEIVVQLARHFTEADIRDKAIHYLRLAGERAAAQYANEAAISNFNRALSFLTPDIDAEEYFELLLKRERIYSMQGDRKFQIHDLELLANLAKKLDISQPKPGFTRRGEVALRKAAYAESIGAYQDLADAAEEAIELAHQVQDISIETSGYLYWGRALWRQGDYEMANMQLQTSLDLSRQAKLRREEADSLRYLGIVFARSGDYPLAVIHLKEALAIYNEIGDRQGQTNTINALGVFAAERGNFDTARIHFEQTLIVYREIGDRWGEGTALSNLGQVCAERGNYTDARQYLEQALDICTQIDDRDGEGSILNNIGQIANEQGDYGSAKKYLERAVETLHEIGNSRVQGFALANLGLAQLHMGNFKDAEQNFKQGLNVLRIIDNPQGQSLVLTYNALCMHHQAKNEIAKNLCLDALKIARDIGDRAAQAYALTVLGHVQMELECFPETASAYQEALKIRQELGQINLAVEVRAGVVRLALRTDELKDAQSQVEIILEYLKDGNLGGTLEPLRVYLTCIQALQVFEDERYTDLLTKAELVLHGQAYRIQEKKVKKMFFASQYAAKIIDLKNKNIDRNQG